MTIVLIQKPSPWSFISKHIYDVQFNCHKTNNMLIGKKVTSIQYVEYSNVKAVKMPTLVSNIFKQRWTT